MKLEVRKARAAAVAANLAAQAAVAARELLAEAPSAWEVGDAAYWLCRADPGGLRKTPPTPSTPRKPWRTDSDPLRLSRRPTTPWKKPATRRTNWSLWPKN